jgi:hypothetical protein
MTFMGAACVRAQAIERAADGVARQHSLVILDGADPEEDEDIDEVHALVSGELGGLRGPGEWRAGGAGPRWRRW